MTMSRDEIERKVRQILIDALGVDEDEVTPDAILMKDLGAESIDFLDIVFRLEKTFAIKIPRDELFPAESLMSNPEFVVNGKLTAKGMAQLRERLPNTDLKAFEKNPDINNLPDLFTVSTIVNFVESKLNSG